MLTPDNYFSPHDSLRASRRGPSRACCPPEPAETRPHLPPGPRGPGPQQPRLPVLIVTESRLLREAHQPLTVLPRLQKSGREASKLSAFCLWRARALAVGIKPVTGTLRVLVQAVRDHGTLGSRTPDCRYLATRKPNRTFPDLSPHHSLGAAERGSQGPKKARCGPDGLHMGTDKQGTAYMLGSAASGALGTPSSQPVRVGSLSPQVGTGPRQDQTVP